MRRLSLLCVTAAVLLAAGSLRAADDAKDELKKLDGTWLVTEGQAGGNPLEGDVKNMKLIIKDGRYEAKIGDNTDKGNLKIDPKKKPKEVDVESVEGPNQGRTFKAIYEITKDTMKVCYQLGDGDRPKEFKSAEGSSIALILFKREK